MEGTRLEKVPPKYRKAVEAQLKNISVVVQARRKEMGLTVLVDFTRHFFDGLV